jgi:hypothetical protein
MTWATTVYQLTTENKIKISEPLVLRFGMCSGYGLLLVRVSRQLDFYEVSALRLTFNLGARVSSFSGSKRWPARVGLRAIRWRHLLFWSLLLPHNLDVTCYKVFTIISQIHLVKIFTEFFISYNVTLRFPNIHTPIKISSGLANIQPLGKIFAALGHHTTSSLQQGIDAATRKICNYTSIVLIKFSGRGAMLLPKYLSIT